MRSYPRTRGEIDRFHAKQGRLLATRSPEESVSLLRNDRGGIPISLAPQISQDSFVHAASLFGWMVEPTNLRVGTCASHTWLCSCSSVGAIQIFSESSL